MDGGRSRAAFGGDSLAAALGERYEEFESLEARAGTLIYRARQCSTGRWVAIKLLMNDRRAPGDPPVEEVTALAELSWHGHVVSLIEAGATAEGIPFIVTEFVPGGTLADVEVDDEAVGVEGSAIDVVLDAAVQVASALAAAHRLGVVHCDVKPSNVLLAPDGTARLGDFGIARMLEHTAPTLEDVRGTVHFVAPEVLDGGQPTAASDVFALGRTITAVVESDGAGSESFLAAVARDMQGGSERMPRLRRHLADAPATIAVIEAMLDPDPAKRPSAADVAERLSLLRGSDTADTAPTPAPPRSHRPRRQREPLATRGRRAALVVAGIALASTGIFLGSADNDAPAGGTATPGQLCDAATEMVRTSNQFIDNLTPRLRSDMSTYQLLHYLLREVPKELARRAQGLVDTARRFPATRPWADQLSTGSLERLVLADGIYNVGRSKFIIGDNADVDSATVPAIVRQEALAWDRLSDTARRLCDLPKETTQKASVGTTLRERLSGDELADLFDDPRSYDLFDDQFVVLILELAPSYVHREIRGHDEWVETLFTRRPSVRELFFRHYPELVLAAAGESPKLADWLQHEKGDWLRTLEETINGLDDFRRSNLRTLYRAQMEDLGIEPRGS